MSDVCCLVLPVFEGARRAPSKYLCVAFEEKAQGGQKEARDHFTYGFEHPAGTISCDRMYNPTMATAKEIYADR